MKINIIGPGALGCLLAAFLKEAGEEVCLVDYRPERVASLGRQGLVLHTLEGRSQVVRVAAALPQEADPAELVIVAVKAHRTATAARSLPALLGPQGIALTLQNGLGNLETMAEVIGWQQLLAGVIFAGATRPRDGEVIYAGVGATYLGIPANSQVSTAQLTQVVEVFHRAGLQCHPHEDIYLMLWEKLLVNVGINPLTAILRVSNGALLKIPEAWELAVAAAQEAREVALAANVNLTADPEALLRRVCTATAANRSSMLQDILAGRPTEIDALNGQVVNRGAAFQVQTPVNYFLINLIRAIGKKPALES
jgi:2-dehydropantoate 2-reductase